VVRGLLFSCAAVSVLTTLAIVFVLFEEAIQFFRLPGISLADFLLGTTWQPFGTLRATPSGWGCCRC
jgi:phosphate transport system permease protein